MKILIHTCCGPCLTSPAKWLRKNGFDLTSYYYNPNIYPEAEFIKRYFVLKKYANEKKIPLVFEFDKKKTDSGDCRNCYETRLLKTAEYAKNNGFQFFSTTLLISPYQNQELLLDTGKRIGELVGVEFLSHDFRKHYRESREISKEFGLYQQKYCGCKKSEALRSSKSEGGRSRKSDKVKAFA